MISRKTLFIGGILTLSVSAWAQNSVGIGTTTPNPKAVLELVSPNNNQGLLVPRLTTFQRTSPVFTAALQSSENGLLVFDSSDGQFYYWHGGQWQLIRSGAGLTAGTGIDISGNVISAIADGDGDASNEIQNITTSKVGSTVDLQITGGTGGSFSVDDADADPVNEIQDLQLIGNTLSITNNTSATPINLSAFTGTNTDDQSITYNPTSGQLDISGLSGGNSVTVTPAGAAGGILSGSYPDPSLNLGAGNAIVGVLNNVGTTLSLVTGLLDPSVVLDTDILGLGDISGSFLSGLQINPNVITSAELLDGTIATADLALGAVTSANILDGTIDALDISNNAITSSKILDGTISAIDIADAAVTDAKIASGIDVSKLVGGTDSQVLRTNSSGQPEWINLLDLTGGLPLGIAGGDLTGVYPIPTIANTAAAGNHIISAVNSASSGTINTGKLNSSVVLDTESPTSGDISGTFNAGLSINTGAVTNVKLGTNLSVSKLASSATNGQVLTTSAGATIWANPADNSSTNEIQDIRSVLQTGSDANSEVLTNLKTLSVGTTKTDATLNVIGSQAVGVTNVTAEPYEIKPGDYVLIVQGSTQNVIIPDANDMLGRILILRSVDSKGFMVQKKDAADKIDGLDTVQVVDNTNAPNCITLVAANKDQWYIINKAIKY